MSRAEGFAAIPNWLFRDRPVSAAAIIVYGALASHSGPGGIYPSQETLAEEAQCSVRRVRDALKELEVAGLVVRVRRRRGAGLSTALTTGYELRPHGRLSEGEERLPADSAGSLGRLPAESDKATGRIEQVAPYIEEEPIKKNHQSDRFDEFWSSYPRKVGKAGARKKFEQLVKVTPAEEIIQGARRFAADPNLPEPQYIPHPLTWLSQGRWDDEPLPARTGRQQPVEDEADAWAGYKRIRAGA